MALANTTSRPQPATSSWGILISEALLFVLFSALLFMLAARVPDARADMGFLCACGLALQAVAFVRLATRVQRVLDTDCPECTQNFHGFPDRHPVPFRRHCAHCGAASQPRS